MGALWLPGDLLGIPASIGIGDKGYSSGGGGGSYTAKAVHFDGTAWLTSADNLGVVDGPNGILSFWGKQAVDGDLFQNGNVQLLVTNDGSSCWMSCPVENNATVDGNRGPGVILWNATGQGLNLDSTSTVPVSTWFHCLMSWNTNFASGSRRIACYINDVLTPFDTLRQDNGSAYSVHYNDPPWTLGNYSAGVGPNATGPVGDMADVYFNTVATIVEADGTILSANRRKFISGAGKPVSLGADGSTPTGATPTLFMTGNAAAWPSNAAGTGALTLTGALTDAATSPSD